MHPNRICVHGEMEIKMDIISELDGKRILIWGYGREGKATEHFLERCVKPASVDIFEGKREEINEDAYDFIIKSPGIVMKEENPKYTSETELFLQQFRDQVIGITGTKGKSTTSAKEKRSAVRFPRRKTRQDGAAFFGVGKKI